MRNQKLTYFSGNYQEYQENDENTRKNKEKQQAALDKKKAHIEKSIQEGLKQARQKGDDKKLSMVASRKKKLQDRLGVERSALGHRFHLHRDMVGYFHTSRIGVEIDQPDAPIRWQFPQPRPLRHQGSLISAESISFAYQNMVLSQVTLNVGQHARIGIVGENGGGKSTLLKLLLGELYPKSGTISRHPQAKIGYFSQEFVTEITKTSQITLEYLIEKIPDMNEGEIRGLFGGFGITGEQMLLPVNHLSGGQAVRIAVGLAVWNAPSLLVLDEITNHLDMDSIAALIESINTFSGGVIVVSHDQHFIKAVAKQVYLVKDCKLELLEDGVQTYVNVLLKEIRKGSNTAIS